MPRRAVELLVLVIEPPSVSEYRLYVAQPMTNTFAPRILPCLSSTSA
jgi:hypothetical protein